MRRWRTRDPRGAAAGCDGGAFVRAFVILALSSQLAEASRENGADAAEQRLWWSVSDDLLSRSCTVMFARRLPCLLSSIQPPHHFLVLFLRTEVSIIKALFFPLRPRGGRERRSPPPTPTVRERRVSSRETLAISPSFRASWATYGALQVSVQLPSGCCEKCGSNCSPQRAN